MALLEDGIKIENNDDAGDLMIVENDQPITPECEPESPESTETSAPTKSPAMTESASTIAFQAAAKPKKAKIDMRHWVTSTQLDPWYATPAEPTLPNCPQEVILSIGGSFVKPFRARGLYNTVWAAIYDPNIHNSILERFHNSPPAMRAHTPKIYNVIGYHAYTGNMLQSLSQSLLSIDFNKTVKMIGFAATIVMQQRKSSPVKIAKKGTMPKNSFHFRPANDSLRINPAVENPVAMAMQAPQVGENLIAHQPKLTPEQIHGDLPVLMSRRPIDHGIGFCQQAFKFRNGLFIHPVRQGLDGCQCFRSLIG